MNKNLLFIICTLFLILLGSCINDDLSDCWQGRYLYFEINKKNKDYDFKEEVQQLDLFIYNNQNNKYKEESYTKDQLKSLGYKVYIPDSDEGEFTYVAIVNAIDMYEIKDIDKLNTLTTSLKSDSEGVVANRINNLFQGHKIIKNKKGDIVNDTIYLNKNTNDIHLKVRCDGFDLPPDTELNTCIKGKNGEYNSENKPVGSKLYTYEPYDANKESSRLFSSEFTTLRLSHGDNTNIEVEQINPNREPEVARVNIAEVLAQVIDKGEFLYNTNEKLDRYDDFTLELVLNAEFVISKIIVNEWAVIEMSIVFE